MRNFYEWLSGFTDGEGSFFIAISRSCAFRFQINLHKDDIDVLYYIHKTLGFGEIRSYKDYSSFTVTRLKDIAQLLNIFAQYPLQGSKWLNYRIASSLDDRDSYYSPLKDCFNCRAQFIVRMNNDHCSFISGDLVTNHFISQLLFTRAIPSIFKMHNLFAIPFRRYYSKKPDFPHLSVKSNIQLNPFWVTGFVYGEGCFTSYARFMYIYMSSHARLGCVYLSIHAARTIYIHKTINIYKDKNLKVGWRVRLFFLIGLHVKDKALLETIKNFFGVGNIYSASESSVQYQVSSINDIKVIINHFDKYKLITNKRADFMLFKEVYNLIFNKEHLTTDGLHKIVAIRTSLNWSLTVQLTAAFPTILPSLRSFYIYIYVDPRSFCMGGPDGPRTQNYIYM